VLDFTAGKMLNSYPKDAAKRSSMSVVMDNIPDNESTEAELQSQ